MTSWTWWNQKFCRYVHAQAPSISEGGLICKGTYHSQGADGFQKGVTQWAFFAVKTAQPFVQLHERGLTAGVLTVGEMLFQFCRIIYRLGCPCSCYLYYCIPMDMKPCRNVYEHSTTVQATLIFQLWSIRTVTTVWVGFRFVVGALDARLQEIRDRQENGIKASSSRVSSHFETKIIVFEVRRFFSVLGLQFSIWKFFSETAKKGIYRPRLGYPSR